MTDHNLRSSMTSGLRRCLWLGFVASCIAPEPTPEPAGDNVPDAFGQSIPDPVRTTAVLDAAKPIVRPGSVVQTEPRLGVPTFLWARNEQVAPSTRWITSGVARPEISASRAAIAEYASLYRLTDTDVADA